MFCSLTSLSCSFSGLLAAESYLLGASAMTVTSSASNAARKVHGAWEDRESDRMKE